MPLPTSPSELLEYFVATRKHLAQMSPVFLEKAPDGLVVINEEGYICLVNERSEFIFGYDRSEMEGQLVHMLLPSDKRERHVRHITNYFCSPSVREMGQDMVLEGQNKKGVTFKIKVSLSPATTIEGVFAAAWIRRLVDGPTTAK